MCCDGKQQGLARARQSAAEYMRWQACVLHAPAINPAHFSRPAEDGPSPR